MQYSPTDNEMDDKWIVLFGLMIFKERTWNVKSFPAKVDVELFGVFGENKRSNKTYNN